MRRILFINPFGIGDCLFTTPLISAIKKAWPDSFIGYWCNQRVAEILESNPRINVVFHLSRGDIKRLYGKSLPAQAKNTLSLYRKIKNGMFDTSLDFSLDYRYGLLTKLCGIKNRIGVDYKKRSRFLTQRLEISGYTQKHVVEYYLQLLSFLGLKSSNPELELFITDDKKSWARDFLAKHNMVGIDLVAVCPGAGESWGKDAFYKRWQAQGFASVCRIVIAELKAKVLLFGNKQEEEICDNVYNLVEDKEGLIKAYPDLSLSEFAALLAGCKVLLTNDGGPLHMAAALKVRTVSIFGPVSELVYGPYPKSNNHIVIKSSCPCRPCYNDFRFTGCAHERCCLTEITAEDVFKSIRRLW
jgi:ADP-heptose:LPS heptosyltransferase